MLLNPLQFYFSNHPSNETAFAKALVSFLMDLFSFHFHFLIAEKWPTCIPIPVLNNSDLNIIYFPCSKQPETKHIFLFLW